ncbi:hypothetical protein [Streptomyces sp. CA-106131]|uniref:hypothetical protein n=1 Tax=Streptomyces sp. CA-106131 TaxID=3240045 RepID=UPI003D8B1ADA
MTVQAPTARMEITGTASARDTHRQPHAAGATVQINGRTSPCRLTTQANGQYDLWPDATDSPVTITVTNNGYQPATERVPLHTDKKVTINLNLT